MSVSSRRVGVWTKVAAGVGIALVLLLGLVWLAGRGVFGGADGPGEVAPTRRPEAVVASTERAVHDAADAVGVAHPKQILFGDLHVHTTFSQDAFMFSLPMLQGEGAHPPADACDFARYCSALDFWSINDHAGDITPGEWADTVDSIRQCNAIDGDGENPDTVAFLGWEWTQVGLTPETHYGHRNVILAGTGEGEVPPRPIAATRPLGPAPPVLGLGAAALLGGGRMYDLAAMFAEAQRRQVCPDGVPTTELPPDCLEQAPTPADLFRKLDEAGLDAIVIPHGTTWGIYTPPGSTWAKQLHGPMYDPDRQRLIEIYSGHGDAEVYRDWRAVEVAEDGSRSCPAPRPDYLPSCWQAGELVRERCLAAGESAAECEARAVVARQNAVDAGVAIKPTVPGTHPEDWLDAGQCRDCREPSFNYRPGGSAQYISAIGDFDEKGKARHFRMGFIGSSDNHFARPGTGYKELHRRGFTESLDGAHGFLARSLLPKDGEPVAHSVPYELDSLSFGVMETERQGSFFVTGGLVGLHAEGRDRKAIWSALKRREVYGTSGPRILLWFDLLNPPDAGPGQTVPMGGAVQMEDAPRFEARAAGSFEQLPGCPDYAVRGLGPEKIERVCKGECWNPSPRRRPITRIEVVRIRPQSRPGEDLSGLIDDPWKSFACEPDPEGCVVTFSDPEYTAAGRDALYYVRAFESAAPAVNAGNLRCERDEQGECVRTHACPDPDGSNPDCLAEDEPRAWSSPVFIDHPAAHADP